MSQRQRAFWTMTSDIALGRKVLTATSLECCQMYKSNILDGKRHKYPKFQKEIK